MTAAEIKEEKPPFPPFDETTAKIKVRAAEDAWNTKNPGKVALAYTVDTVWRNRSEFLAGRTEVEKFLTRKWEIEIDYRLCKELWAFAGKRIAVRFAYEWHDAQNQWFRSYGNENWEFAPNGLMQRRIASINDIAIKEGDRRFHWPSGPRPSGEGDLSDFGF